MPNKGPRANPPSRPAVLNRHTVLRAAAWSALGAGSLAATVSAAAANITSTWKTGVTGNWNDATKWTNSPAAATFPNNGNLANTYDAVLNSGTATLNLPVTLRTLTLTGGMISPPAAPAGTNSISVTTGFTFGGGELNVPVNVPAAATFTIGSGTSRLGASLSTSGPVAFSGTGPHRIMAVDPLTRWTVQPTGTLALGRTLTLTAPPSDPFGKPDRGLFDNAGTITTSAGAVLDAEVYWAVRNFGTIRVGGAFDLKTFGFSTSGLVDLTSAASAMNVQNFEVFETSLAGSVRVAAGARLNFASGGIGLSNVSFTNAGTINFNGQLRAYTPSTVPGVVTFATNGAILADAPLALPGPVSYDAGLIAGTSRVTATNLTFKAGGIRDAELFVPAGGTLTFSGTAQRTIQRFGKLTVDGTAHWLGGRLTADSVTNRVSVTPGGVFNVPPSGTATFDRAYWADALFDRLDNAGLINVDGGTLSLGPSWSLGNSGTVRVTAGGALALSTGSLTGSGTIELQSGASATFGGSNAATFSIAPAALLDVRASATATFTAPFSGSGRLSNAGLINVAGRLTVDPRWSTDNAGTLRLTSATAQLGGNLSNTGSVTVDNGSLQITASQVTNAGRIELHAGASMTFAPQSSLRDSNGFRNVAGGLLYVGPSAAASIAGSYGNVMSNAGAITVDRGRLTVNDQWAFSNTGTITVTSGTLKFYTASHTSPYTNAYTNTGSIDLRGGAALILARPPSYYTDPAQTLNKVRDQILSGHHGGAWDGPGIRSASAAADPVTAVGYAVASTPGTFLGEAVAAGDVLVRPTRLGDASLDGVVNFADLLALAKNYNTTARHWFHGDFNYDGAVNFVDLLTLAKNYNQALPTEPLPGAATFAADLAAAFAQVPEPSTALLALAAACGFARPARRHRKVRQ